MGCSICLESYVFSLPLTFLSCGHVFHQQCYIEWRQIRATCPTCAAESLPVRAYMDFQTEIDDMRDNLRFLNEIEELMVQLRTVFEATDNGGGVQNGGGQVGAQPEPLQLVPMRVARLLPIQIRVRGVRRRFYRLQQVRRRVHVRRHINH